MQRLLNDPHHLKECLEILRAIRETEVLAEVQSLSEKLNKLFDANIDIPEGTTIVETDHLKRLTAGMQYAVYSRFLLYFAHI